MAITFPASPSDGDVFTNTTTGVEYIYNATDGVWKTHVWPTNTNYLQLSGGTLTGNLSLGTNDVTAVGDVTASGAISANSLSTTAGLTVGNGLTVSDGNVVMADGHGIDFNGELLGDYETGTFTPKYITSGGGDNGIGMLTQNGDYVKIGNLVYVSVQLSTDDWDPLAGASGDIYIDNFPFQISTSGLNTGSAFSVSFRREFANDKGTNLTARFVDNTGTKVYLYDHGTTSATSSYLTESDFMDGASENYIYGSGWYFTDS